MTDFIPAPGDIIFLNFNPQSGHEQGGYRPALVLSPKEYNQKTDLAIVCPITSQIKNYPFKVTLPKDSPVHGAILCDHLRNLSWKNRQAKLAGKTTSSVLNEAQELIKVFLNL